MPLSTVNLTISDGKFFGGKLAEGVESFFAVHGMMLLDGWVEQ
ncbi:hypothetical protein AB6A23_24940 [Paenibacillus tarimensis]